MPVSEVFRRAHQLASEGFAMPSYAAILLTIVLDDDKIGVPKIRFSLGETLGKKHCNFSVDVSGPQVVKLPC